MNAIIAFTRKIFANLKSRPYNQLMKKMQAFSTVLILLSMAMVSYSQHTDDSMQAMGFKKIEVRELKENTIKLFADDWGLVTAGDSADFNTMTISWGGIGNLWNKPATFIFIKPERYTFGFIEKHQSYTISFFDHAEYQDDLLVCGSKSGRDGDKLKETKLTKLCLPSGEMAFKEARIIFECKIIYQDSLNSETTPDREKKRYYKTDHFHKLYVGEITAIWRKESE